MKKLTTLLLIFGSYYGQAQSLPKKATIVLTDTQIQSVYAKIDSIQGILIQTSSMPSNQVQGFLGRLNSAILPITEQIRKQMVVDTAKKK